MKYIFIPILLLCGISLRAQTGQIQGTITNTKKQPLFGITIFIDGTKQGAATNFDGLYKLNEIASGNHIFIISGIGFKTQKLSIRIPAGAITHQNIVLAEDASQLNEVVISGKTKIGKLEAQGYAVKSIDVKKLKNKTTDVTQILNNVSGVNIRSEGGVGSNYKLSLNGLTGNQVRIFIDDIPVDELGEAFNLNNIPVNLIERIDVYKGVVPVKLGADALGGAINIITDQKKKSFLDASYSIGSFNTHKATINSKYKSDTGGFIVNFSGAYNYSDNDYTMYDLEYFTNKTVIENGLEVNKQTEVVGDVKRFHDHYKALIGNVGIGFIDTKWTDEFLVDFSISKIDRDIQGLISRAIGEATENEKNKTYRLKYKRSGFFNNKLKLDLFAMYNDIRSTKIDTSSNRYNWDGTFRVNQAQDGQGEFLTDKTLFKFNQKQFQYRVNLDYSITKNHTIRFNHIYSDITREGENRINAEQNQPFQSPNTLQKTVTGLEYSSNFFDKKLEFITAIKAYHFDILTKQAINFSDGGIGLNNIQTTQNNFGYLFSSRYFITPHFFVKASFEKGYRIPLPLEIFGDGLGVLANPELQPETSHNLNIGLSHNLNTKRGYLKNDINLFQRDVKDFIRLKFLGLVNSYQNESDILIQGIEWDAFYKKQNVSIATNLTWQNVLNNQNYESGSILEQLYEKEQLPNTPFLFGNANINYTFQKLFRTGTTSIYYGINYVKAFYLNYKNVATLNPDKNTIPSQLINNVGTTFSTKNRKHHINFEIQNLFNQIVFDNFKQQKPGAALYLKYRYVLD